MSAKWIRSKAWDDRHLTGSLWPVKFAARTFSSIWFSVLMLVLVAVYGILASVPIGLVALLPTWLAYAASLLAAIGLGAVLPLWALSRLLAGKGVGPATRFTIAILGFLVLAGASVVLWHELVWPVLRYDALRGTGLRFFGAFVDRYKAVQLRRLPGVEMSELEFYGWWPLRVVLLLFVLNMVTATLRRIEFVFVNLGVLSVHTGIVILALGSAYYASHKQEGDMVLLAGGVTNDGKAIPGRPETGFFDNTRVALWITADASKGWEQRVLEGVPRYNDYGLSAVPGYEPPVDEQGHADAQGSAQATAHRDFGPLDVRVPDADADAGARAGVIDPGLKFRVVGYASYAELLERWVPRRSAAKGSPAGAGAKGPSMRELHAFLRQPGQKASAGEKPAMTWRLIPELPSERVAALDILNIEHTRGMSLDRWRDLTENLPEGAKHAIVVEVPGAAGAAAFRGVYAIEPGKSVAIGQTGWTLEVKDIQPVPPLAIVTQGYRDARSSVAIVRVIPPEGSGITPFARWVYHRFPEISQDLSDELNENSMPKRRDADARIRIGYIDASVMQVYVDERDNGVLRVLARSPGGGASVTEGLKEGGEIQLAPQLALRIGSRLDNVERVEVPRVVPENDREKNHVGNHEAAAIALEITDPAGLKQVEWVPFTQYLGMSSEGLRRVRLADGRELKVAFSRVRHDFFPPMSVRLADFEMIPYPHSSTPRDYRSELVVDQSWGAERRSTTHATSLNEPLLVRRPFVPRDDVIFPVNFAGRLVSLIAPNQYKFSQAGWDQGGWTETEQAVAAGRAPRAWARFTILGVGSNPGIYIIASGAVIMACGIPWAFYVKPWILRLRKKRIQAELARGGFVRSKPAPGHESNGTAAEAVATTEQQHESSGAPS